MPALLAGLAFLLLGLAYLPQAYDGSAFTYFILAERGLYKAAQEAHPLYLPLLRPVVSLFGLAGGQVLSLLGGAGALALLTRLGARGSGAPWAAAAAVLAFGLERQFWWLSGQTKPYSLSAMFGLLALVLLTRRPAWAGFSLALSIGFHAVNVAFFPVVWLMASFEGLDRRSLAAFHAAALIPCALWLLLLPELFWKTLALMQDYAAHRSWTAQGFLAEAAARHWEHLRISLPQAPWLLVPLAAAGSAPWRDAEVRRRGAAAALFAVSLSAVLIVFDARNDYAYVMPMLVPPLLAAACRTPVSRALLGAVVLAVGAGSFRGRIRPASRPDAEPARAEARFLKEHCPGACLVLAAGAPDWRLARFMEVPLVRADGRALYEPPSEEVSPRALGAVDGTLAAGGRVYLAADHLVRPSSVWAAERIDAYQAAVLAKLQQGRRLGQPVVSPRGQWYVPVSR